MKTKIKAFLLSSGVFLAVAFYLLLSLNPVQAADPVLTVGATASPFAQILEAIKPVLKRDGVELKIIEFSDYVTPNLALADGSLDANTFQHIPYFERFKADRNLDLVSVAKTIIIPIAIYSDKYKSLTELPDGSTIAIPNDPTNGGRALLLFEKAGLIKLADSAGIAASVVDIESNPHNFHFYEVDAAQTARVIPDVAAAAVNSNYALELGMNPQQDSIYIEDADSPYVCIVAVKREDQANQLINKFINAYHSEKVREFIKTEFNGAVIPAF